MKNSFRLFQVVGIFVFLFSNAFAQTQPTISYQGVLQNNGSPVNGPQTMKILIYVSATGGTALYSETQTDTLTNGLFNISIGSVTPLLPTLDFRKQYYLAVSVNGGAETSPRSLVSFAPYAFRALISDTASYAAKATVANGLSSGAVNSVNGETGTVTVSGANGITVSNSPPNIVIGSTGVQSLNTQGGKLTLVGAGGTTITDTGSVLTIRSATFTGGTGVQAVQNSDGSITIANGSGPIVTISLAQQSATNGQALVWNGSAWKPATISGSSGVDSIKDLQDCRDDGSSVYIGAGSGVNNSGKDMNVALGIGAMHANTTGTDNVAIGDSALTTNTIGSSVVAIGKNALAKYNFANSVNYGELAIGTGAEQNMSVGYSYNTAIGFQALSQNTIGAVNTAVGYQAMAFSTTKGNNGFGYNQAFGYQALANDTGFYNCAFGSTAMMDNTSGSGNCAFGSTALGTGRTGSFNTAIGFGAMVHNDSGSFNVAVGAAALFIPLERSHIVAIGDSALYNNGTSQPNQLVPAGGDSAMANTAVGAEALRTNGTGSYNTATGYQALYSNSVGYRNTSVGYEALNSNVTGSDNTAVGSSAGTSTSLNNTTTLGSGAQATASNEVVLGNGNVTSFYCQGAYAATTANSANLVVTASGQIMRSTSSARYKTNIRDLDFNADAIYNLRPVSYTSKLDGKPYFGLVAEDVAKVFPELAEYARAKDVIPGSTSEELIPDAVKYPMLSVLLLQELKKEHEKGRNEERQLENQSSELKSEAATIANLERRIETLESSQKSRP